MKRRTFWQTFRIIFGLKKPIITDDRLEQKIPREVERMCTLAYWDAMKRDVVLTNGRVKFFADRAASEAVHEMLWEGVNGPDYEMTSEQRERVHNILASAWAESYKKSVAKR